MVIPTYNERENISILVKEILNLKQDFHIFIVDGSSCDGTAELAEELSKEYEGVSVLRHLKKEGLGRAYIEGFKWALSKGFDYIFEMDADLSHSPKYLPLLFDELGKSDVVVGSRYLYGLRVVNWKIWRLLLSRCANFYSQWFSGLKIYDSTSGFVGYRREVLENIDLSTIASTGYAFHIEIKCRCQNGGFKIKEIPIIFVERRHGKSKISKTIIIEAFILVLKLGVKRCLKKMKFLFRR